MGKLFFTLVTFVVMSLNAGCASVSSEIVPGASLENIETVYVQKLPADERGIEKVISDQLSLLGFKSSHGTEAQNPGPVDAVVTYQDKWMWDLTMYMMQLDLQIRNAEDGSLVASGKSYRPSMQRRSPDVMAREVLEAILQAGRPSADAEKEEQVTAAP